MYIHVTHMINASLNGIDIIEFAEGSFQEVPDDLGASLIASGFAIAAEDEPMLDIVLKRKAIKGAPENK